MSVNMKNWQELKKPNALDVTSGGDAKRKATFVAEPLERGFGPRERPARASGGGLHHHLDPRRDPDPAQRRQAIEAPPRLIEPAGGFRAVTRIRIGRGAPSVPRPRHQKHL